MDEIAKHQIRSLQDEIAFLRRSLDFVPAPVFWACVQVRRFRWTMSRLLGLDSQRAAATTGREDFPALPVASLSGRRVFLDATDTVASAETTGVRRVVRELCRAAAQDRSATPVRIEGERFVALDGSSIDFRAGDGLVLLDAGWIRTPQYVAAVQHARTAGCAIVLGLYDLIPLNQPGFTPRVFAAAFETWIRALTPLSDAAIAISHAVANDFRAWLASSGVAFRPSLKVGWFALGANLDAPKAGAPSARVQAFLANNPRYFLSVGTLEPRKGHAVALDAFERFWSEGGDASYVIVGRRGFASDALIDRIESHPEFGRKLLWLSDAGDGDLTALYASTLALILPSIAEGFGLPLVEAAHFGAPVIASDIPVLREVGEGKVDYFRVLDADDLAGKLAAAANHRRAAPALVASSWRQAAATLTNMVAHDTYQTAIHEVGQ